MKKFFRVLINALSILIILSFIVYSIAWFAIAYEMQKRIDNVWVSQEKLLIHFQGEKPKVSGFPAPPEIRFAGSLTDRKGLIYQSPEFIYRGFPLPTQRMTLEAPQGISFSGPVLRLPVDLNYFKLAIRLPANFPGQFDADTIREWQRVGGSIPVEELRIVKGGLNLEADGYVQLDVNLQPEGTLTAKVTGLDDLLHELTANGTIGEKQALMGQSLLNLMSQKDEQTGITSVNVGISVQDGGVFLSGLRVASLPEWKWE